MDFVAHYTTGGTKPLHKPVLFTSFHSQALRKSGGLWSQHVIKAKQETVKKTDVSLKSHFLYLYHIPHLPSFRKQAAGPIEKKYHKKMNLFQTNI